MGRRASSNFNAPLGIGIIVGIFLLGGGAMIALKGKKQSFSDATPLRMSEFMDNGNSMRGMEYRVEGSIKSRYPRDGGLGLSVEVIDGSSKEYLFIIVPKDLAQMNIARDQSYAFKIRFAEGGIAVATAVQRL